MNDSQTKSATTGTGPLVAPKKRYQGTCPRGSTQILISGLLPDDEMEQIIKETGEGLESIRFGISDNLDSFPEQLEAARRNLQRLEHPRLWIHGPFQDLSPVAYDSMIQRVVMERFNQAYQAAVELGAEGIVFHSGFIPATHYLEGWAERTAAFFMEFMEGKAGVQVALENVYDRAIEPILEVVETVQAVHPEFGFCLDLGHAHCYSGHPVSEWINIASPYIRHVHVHDNDGTLDSHLALGQGTIAYEEAISRIARLPQIISWTIECSTKKRVLETYETLVSCLSNATADDRTTT